MSNLIKIKWYSTIRTKIALALIIPVFLVMAGFSAYSVWNDYQLEVDDLKKLSIVSAERMSNHLKIPMWDLNNDQVKSALTAEMQESRIKAIVVWDAEKKKVFEAKERRTSNDKELIVDFSGIVNASTEASSSIIQRDKETLGEVSVYVSKANLVDNLKKSALEVLIASLILIILLVLILSVMLDVVLVGPIVHLSEQAVAMSKGQLDQKFAESNDEIGYLARSLGRMQSSLRIVFERFNKQQQ
ncbi:HAMP domain-containing protein [Leucothrix arctica]|uniref:histidine kinase n=1 Tax=Leucothrix arctica TaxID=1481894 RepID=A0A317CTM1_9GAMM|nr:HAMP domain-containing protein [Leucothrix arctica]PWQ99652.1 hypothetical protein DKT75_00850 [Leucothrix arctica]